MQRIFYMNVSQNDLYNAIRYYSYNGDLVDFVTFTNVKSNRRSFISCFNDLVDRLEERVDTFRFFAVFTLEGNGVIHCIFINCYFDINELKSLWFDLTGAFEVRKSRFIEGKEVNLSCYLNTQDDYLKTDFTQDFFVDKFEIVGDSLGVVYEKVE